MEIFVWVVKHCLIRSTHLKWFLRCMVLFKKLWDTVEAAVITLVQIETDNINSMITITGCFNAVMFSKCLNGTHKIWLQQVADNINRDHIKRLPLLLHCDTPDKFSDTHDLGLNLDWYQTLKPQCQSRTYEEKKEKNKNKEEVLFHFFSEWHINLIKEPIMSIFTFKDFAFVLSIT